MLFKALQYRPTKVSDNAGGFTVTIGDGVGIFVSATPYKEEMLISVRTEEDVQAEDIFLIDGAYYRVTRRTGSQRAGFALWAATTTERPVSQDG